MEIKVNNISYSYQDNKVIDNISCLIKENMISAFVGKNGSGKTALLNIIDGLQKPTNGYIKIGDTNRKKIGYLLESTQIFNTSVYMEIKYSLDYYKIKDIDKKIRSTIKLVGLTEDYLSKNPKKLNNGELRKVYLASVLAHDPDILILDEPTAGLDNKSKNEFIRLIKKLKKEYEKTIIITSNDTEFIHKIADYVYLIKDGTIYLEGDKYEVLSNEIAMNYCELKVPDVLHFSNLVLKNKNIKIGYRDEINDLIKDVYRYVK